jgi:hypothetical protein
LFTPISTNKQGNGLAHRARFWQTVLSRFGTVETVHLQLAGPAIDPGPSGTAETVPALVAEAPSAAHLPRLARRAPERAGRRWMSGRSAYDIIVVLRSSCAPFAFGSCAGADTLVVVDLDDDDAEFFRSVGDHGESALFDALQADILGRADLVISATGFGTTVAVPNSVAAAAGPPAPRPPGRARAVMVGNFDYAPNIEGARWVLEEVSPLLAEAGVDLEVVVAGWGSERLEPCGVGFVDDLAALYASADVAIVPLLHGAGTRIKALEAFAHRIPVVGTTVGVAGLDVRPGIDCLIADTPAAMAAALRSVVEDPALATRLSRAAFDHVMPKYRRDVVVADATAAIQRTIDDRPLGVLAHANHLDISESEDGLVVLDRASMTVHHLNTTTASVFALLDAHTTLDEIEGELQGIYGATARPKDEVARAAAQLSASGLVIVRRVQPTES